MKRILTKLLFWFVCCFINNTAYAQEKRLDDTFSRFQKLGVVKISETKPTTFDQTIYLANNVFASIDHHFKDCYEEKKPVIKDTTVVALAVYKLNENLEIDSVAIASVFEGMNMFALTQTEVVLFCQTKEIQTLFKTHKGGSIFFLFRRDAPPAKSGESFIVYYYQFCVAEVKKNIGRKKPSVRFYEPTSDAKVEIHEPNLFVVLDLKRQ